MQWLNKVDDALDWVLGSQSSEGNDGTRGDGGMFAVAASSLGELSRGESGDAATSFTGSASHGSNVGDNSASRSNANRVENIGTKRCISAIPRPPPPPPPPVPPTPLSPKVGGKLEISPQPSSPYKRGYYSSLNARPPTPLMTVAGEYSQNSEDGDALAQASPLLSQMQNFARASPAPTKVTIGDRGGAIPSRPHLNLPGGDIQILSKEYGDDGDYVGDKRTISITPNPPPPLPPPPPYFQPKQATHSTSQLPPSTSTVVNLFPNGQHQHQPSPIKWVPPPQGPPDSYNCTRVESEPTNAARPAARIIRQSTPSFIRRDLRKPSKSPPESPTHALSGNDAPKKMYSSISVPLPSFVSSSSEVASKATDLGSKVKKENNSTPNSVALASDYQNEDTLMLVGVVAQNSDFSSSVPPVVAKDLEKNPSIDARVVTTRVGEPCFHANANSDCETPIQKSKEIPAAESDSIHRQGEINNVDKNDVGDDSRSFSDSIHSQNSNHSELTEVNEMDDFVVPLPSFSQTESVDNLPLDPSLNRYGFIHVRLLRAQRLPCISGSIINATLSLQPWNGRIRIPAHIAIEGPVGAGVCLRWDRQSDKKRPGGKSGSSKDRESVDEEPGPHSMVHAYNNSDTPVPTIVLELRSSFGVSLSAFFDKFVCSISVPCHDLLRNPRSWKRQWFPASGLNSTDIDSLVLLEACFEPKVTRLIDSKISSQVIAEEETEVDDLDLFNIPVESDRSGSVPRIIRPTRRGLLDDDSTKSSSTLTTALIHRGAFVTKSHLLRIRTFWTPTWCSICFRSIITVWVQGFECEACQLICCRDCHIQVDACLPCGSEVAKIAVRKAQQYQVPSLSQIMTTIAPHLDTKDATLELGSEGNPIPNFTLLSPEGRSIDGIGIMNVRILRACVFDKNFPPEAEPGLIFESDFNLRNGDHYVRVSWLGSKETRRTKTVLQTPKPIFDSEEMVFDVPHYGMEYKLEVVDANTDKSIGSCLLSAQGLLQWQRDDLFASIDRTLLSLFHLRKYSEPRRLKLELRTGVKNGFGLNFYNSSMSSGDPSKEKESSQRPGEISGWLEIDVHLEEDKQLFYSINPRRIGRPEEEFDLNVIQLHIARITAIFEQFQTLVSTYFYVVSWENQELTSAFAIIFIVLTLRFNIEYLGTLPILPLVLYMSYMGFLRIDGRFKDRWTLQEKEALIKSETKIETDQSIFRPLGLLQVCDLRGKNLRSRELGLPGSFYASISYDPLRYADDKVKLSVIKIDSSSGCTHQVGITSSPGITSRPIWNELHESSELMRLKYLFPNDRLWRPEKAMAGSLSYPILQPITECSSGDDDAAGSRGTGISLMPWEQSCGAVVIQVRYSDVLGSFYLFDNVLGEVAIPLAKLAGSGRAVEGWFRLLDVGTTDTIPGESSDDTADEYQAVSEDLDAVDDDGSIPTAIEYPEIHVKVKFSPKQSLDGGTSLVDDVESFKIVCEEMSRTAAMAQGNRVGVIGSSLNTINTVRTLGGTLQNQISYVVDILERIKNAFNFSNPRISCFILLCLTVLWIILSRIPTRIVILFLGLAQFGGTYYAKFLAPPETNKLADETVDSTNTGNPVENLFLSIPTDEDLRRIYFWEARREGEKERKRFANAKRHSRLEKLWKAKWYGALEVKEKRADLSTTISTRNWSWEPAFGLIEGHRFIWWRSERHFDTGDAPLGQIFFAGHSGLAGLSPLDLREFTKEEVPLVVSIFGRGSQGQQKVTLLASFSHVKDCLENAVLEASMDTKAD